MSHDANRTDVAKLTSRCFMLLTLCVLTGNMVGCNFINGIENYVQYNSPTEDFVSGWRNKVWANRAYNARREMMDPGPYEADYRKGFVAGYANVAEGGQGCTPSLPPRIYWSWRYQSAEGQMKVQAWFAGFPQGARAAEEDGVGNFHEIQIASWMTDGSRECPDCLNDSGWDETLEDPGMMPQPGMNPNMEELPVQPMPTQPMPNQPMPASPAVPMGTETGSWTQPMNGPQGMPEFREPSVTPATYPANLLQNIELRERRPGEDDSPPPPFGDTSLQSGSIQRPNGASSFAANSTLRGEGTRMVSYQEAMAGQLRVSVPSSQQPSASDMQWERFPAVPNANSPTNTAPMQTTQLDEPRVPMLRDWNVDLPVVTSTAGTEAYPRVAMWR